MAAHTSHKHDLFPRFDMETFLALSNEGRLDGAAMRKIMQQWEAWQAHAHACTIGVQGASYALAWLTQEVERETEDAWRASPSEGFLLNVLAQMLVMELIAELSPETAEFGCAPAPFLDAALCAALAAEGVAYTEAGLSRRYAVLTAIPFVGGCEVCRLEPDCPKRRSVETNTVVLSGSSRE